MVRPSWDDYFIELSKSVATRSTCDRGRNGFVIVKEKRVLTTGYAGAPPGMPHCDEVGHLMKKVIDENGVEIQHCMRTTHAEHNAIIQAAKFGISLEGATVYTKMEPCHTCSMAIVGAEIKRVVCEKGYHSAKEGKELLKNAGVDVVILNDEVEKYDKQ